LRAAGVRIAGADIAIHGNLPTGGLSSSASLCVGLAVAIEALSTTPLPGGRVALATLCQQVEHEFANLQCGIMDQAVIALSIDNCALALRCADLSFEHVAAPSGDVAILVMDSGKPRHLADAPYNARQQQVRDAQRVLCKRFAIAAVCDLPVAQLSDALALLDSSTAKRVRHVVTEQQRVEDAIEALPARTGAASVRR